MLEIPNATEGIATMYKSTSAQQENHPTFHPNALEIHTFSPPA